MKELTIKEEALDIVKQMIADGQVSQIAKDNSKFRNKVLAWLEKQELKSNPYSGVSFSYNGNIWGMCARDNEVVEKYFPELKESEDEKIRKWLIAVTKNQGVDILFNKKLIQHISGEKQDKYAENKEFPASEKRDFGYFSETTNKVKPKFNVGDWIIFNGFVLFVKEVVQGYYRTISRDDIPNSYDWSIDED